MFSPCTKWTEATISQLGLATVVRMGGVQQVVDELLSLDHREMRVPQRHVSDILPRLHMRGTTRLSRLRPTLWRRPLGSRWSGLLGLTRGSGAEAPMALPAEHGDHHLVASSGGAQDSSSPQPRRGRRSAPRLDEAEGRPTIAPVMGAHDAGHREQYVPIIRIPSTSRCRAVRVRRRQRAYVSAFTKLQLVALAAIATPSDAITANDVPGGLRIRRHESRRSRKIASRMEAPGRPAFGPRRLYIDPVSTMTLLGPGTWV